MSNKIFNDLLNIGLTPKKTKTLNIKNLKIPEKYKVDFIRGYFDGDGSIVFKKTKSKSITPCCYSICIAGYKDNLLSIKDILSDWDIDLRYAEDNRKDKYSKENENCHFGTLRTVSNINVYKFLKTIYYNDDVLKLERKFLKSNDFLKLVNEYGIDYRKRNK